MKSKAAQYLNEIVSLTILSLMVVALIAGQAAADSRAMALDTTDRYEAEPDTLTLVIDTKIDNLAPIAEAILGDSVSLNGELTVEIASRHGDTGIAR